MKAFPALLISIAAAWSVSCASAATTGPVGSEASAPLSTGALPEVADSGIGYHSPDEALEALRNKAGTKIRQEQGWTIVEDQEAENRYALWSFTPKSNPAYPAAVKRIVFDKDGQTMLDMKVQCFGTKEACDRLVRDFQALNERMIQEMRSRH